MKTNRDESASVWDEVLELRRVNAKLVGALRELLEASETTERDYGSLHEYDAVMGAAHNKARAALRAARVEP